MLTGTSLGSAKEAAGPDTEILLFIFQTSISNTTKIPMAPRSLLHAKASDRLGSKPALSLAEGELSRDLTLRSRSQEKAGRGFRQDKASRVLRTVTGAARGTLLPLPS